MADTIEAYVIDEQAGVRLVIQYENTTTPSCIVGRVDNTGFTQLIRAGYDVPLVSGGTIIYDYEAPLDVAVYYVTGTAYDANGNLVVAAQTPQVTVHSHGFTWLKDPGIPTRNMRLDEVEDIPEMTRAARGGLFHIIDRTHPIAVTSKREGRTGELHFATATAVQRQALITMLARGQILLLQTPGEAGFGSAYIYVGDVVESRFGVMSEQTRKWTLPITMVDRPVGLATSPPGAVWQTVKDRFNTWQDVKDYRFDNGAPMRWDDLAIGEWV